MHKFKPKTHLRQKRKNAEISAKKKALNTTLQKFAKKKKMLKFKSK